MTERLYFDFLVSCIGEENGNPLQCSCLENSRDRGACWATVYGVTQSWTRLKRLSSSSRPVGVSKKYLPSRNVLGEVNRKILKTEQVFKKTIWMNKFNSHCLKKKSENMSTSLNMREMQIKTSIRYHLTLMRMGTGRNSTSSKCWSACRAQGPLLHWCWEWKLGAGTVEDTGQAP